MSLFVWAPILFLAPFCITAAALYLRRTTPVEPQQRYRTLARLVIEIVFGSVYAIANLFLLVFASGDVGIYDRDPSCRQTTNFSEPTTSGACTVVNALVTGEVGFRTSRWSQTPYLAIFVKGEDGRFLSPTSVSLLGAGFPVWRIAFAHRLTPARVQLFRDRVALIRIDGASGPADDLPWQSFSNKVLWVAFGSGLLLAALVEIGLRPLIFKPGELRRPS